MSNDNMIVKDEFKDKEICQRHILLCTSIFGGEGKQNKTDRKSREPVLESGEYVSDVLTNTLCLSTIRPCIVIVSRYDFHMVDLKNK